MNPEKITISILVEDDLDEVVKIGRTTPELHIESESVDYYSIDTLKRFIQSPNDIYLSAKIGTNLIGYLLATFNPYLKEAYLIDIVVKKDYRKQGIANLLINECLNRLKIKDCSWIWMLVKENNIAMQKLLKKKEFSKGNKFYFYHRESPLI